MERNGVIIFPGGAYKLTATALEPAQVTAALRQAASQGYLRTSGAFEIDNKPVTLAMSQDNTLLGVPISGFKLRSHFLAVNEPGDTKVLIPQFRSVTNSIDVSCTWEPPQGMHVLFAFKAKQVEMPAPSPKAWTLIEAYLFVKPEGPPGGFFRLPLPNVFADGRLCMGNGIVFREPTLEKLAKKALAHINESPWGTDMMPDQAKMKKLFRFDVSTLKNLPPVGNWVDACVRVSRVEMETLYPNGGV